MINSKNQKHKLFSDLADALYTLMINSNNEKILLVTANYLNMTTENQGKNERNKKQIQDLVFKKVDCLYQLAQSSNSPVRDTMLRVGQAVFNKKIELENIKIAERDFVFDPFMKLLFYVRRIIDCEHIKEQTEVKKLVRYIGNLCDLYFTELLDIREPLFSDEKDMLLSNDFEYDEFI